VWGYHDWACFRELHTNGRTWGSGYYFDLLPRIVKELDPSRPYWGASPWSGDTDVATGLHPNLASYGNKHAWECWSQPPEVLRSFIPRFTSEFGFHGPPTYATLARAVPEAERRVDSEQMRHRQRSPSWDGHMMDCAARWFGESVRGAPYDRQHYLMQVVQARALQIGVEWFRSRMPECMGTLYWQLNDCWPAVSWSAIDGDGRPKALYFATRRFYAPRLLTIQPRQHMLELCAVNDTDKPWSEPCELYALDMHTGDRASSRTVPFEAAPRSATRLPLPHAPLLRPRYPERSVLVASTPSARALWYYRADKDLAYPPPRLRVDVRPAQEGFDVTLQADAFIRDLCIQIDRLDPAATLSDQLLTLLPGENVTLRLQSAARICAADLLRRGILCTTSDEPPER
jgi:beta-mannosidase